MLPSSVANTQGAFISRRSILHNILLCQDLVKMYKPNQKQKGCLMKIDIHKAYDTMSWEFLEEMMKALLFPGKMIQLIMRCVTTPTFTLMLNGVPTGFYKSQRGLWQGDPMSPLLFVLCMEYFARVMRYVGKQEQFKFHPRCSSLAINHLCFANDMLIFCKGEYPSVLILLQGMKLFADTTRLVANPNKSAIYGCGIDEAELQRMVDCSGYKLGKLPVKYLEVPISSKKLTVADCDQLIDKMVSRIRMWSSRNISFAGRRQLVNVVLMSVCVYWSQVFLLPKKVLKQVNAICRLFLWTWTCNSSRLVYVSWDSVCTPKGIGG